MRKPRPTSSVPLLSLTCALVTALSAGCRDATDPIRPPDAATATAGVDVSESPYIYGVHDHDTGSQEFMSHLEQAGVNGWVTATVAIGSNPNDTGGDDFSWIEDAGHSAIVRLNNGYCGSGAVPTPDRYDDFARRAANYVAASRGAHIWVVANETNLAIEWPPVADHAAYVSPQDYARLFRKVYDAIKAVRPQDRVVSQALAPFAGPFPAGSTCGYSHDGNPLNWVQYMREMLDAIRATGGIDGIALHINSRGYRQQDIHSTQKVSAGGQDLYFSFYVYRDWIEHGIPPELYHLPLYATEANGVYYWSGGHPERPDVHYEPGWVQEIYAEVDRYNQEAARTGKPVFRAVNLYRWCAWCDGWNIDGSPYEGQILSDLDEAVAAGHRWPTSGDDPGSGTTPTGDNVARAAVTSRASSSFNADFGPTRAYDGVVSAASKWTSDGASPTSWLVLDLGAAHEINGFIVRHAGAAGEPAHFNTLAYRLESGSSLDGPWAPLATVDNTAGADATTTTLPSPATTRFVRLLVTDAGVDDYARIPEFEVYGVAAEPDPPDTPTGDNVARAATAARASSSLNADFAPAKAYDGVVSVASKWTSDGVGSPSWLALDLGAAHEINGFIVRHAGAAGEASYFNTRAYRVESGGSLNGPWTVLANVDNSAGADVTTTTLATPATSRYVRLLVTDAGIDAYARIPEFEVYGSPVPDATNLITNGSFEDGLGGWSTWTERGAFTPVVDGGQLHIRSSEHNGGMYQSFNTGGAGTELSIEGLWSSDPTVASAQWAEVLVIDGPRSPQNGQDINAGQSDVVLVYKNDTWATPAGWSGPLSETAPVADVGGFVASGPTATLVLKSGNVGGATTGTRFDALRVHATGSGSPTNTPPVATFTREPERGTAPLEVTFDATGSSDADGDALDFSWDFGDGTTGSGALITHTYAEPGSYLPTLSVRDGAGGTDVTSASVDVSDGTISLPGCPDALDFPSIRSELETNGRDLAFVKIGFHVGPGGNASGLGEWMRCLDAAGVPFFLKSADAAGPIWEAAQLRAESGVPHMLVYRTTSGDGWSTDVPEYDLPAEEAARQHWQRHRDAFPPELEPYRHFIWVETINEVDKNRSGWLGDFAYHTAGLAMADGFNWAAFGWSSGEPERVHWEAPSMLRFLELAGANPDRVAVALHEYSYVRESLDREYPHLVGRFQLLLDIADARGIPRPTVLITEFGWVYDDVAPVSQAMDVDIPWAAELYAGFPQVKGAAIWYLGPGFGGIADRAQKLIEPLTGYSLRNYFVVP